MTQHSMERKITFILIYLKKILVIFLLNAGNLKTKYVFLGHFCRLFLVFA